MVKAPREEAGPGPIRALNLPALVSVEEDEGQRPTSVTVRRRRLEVASIQDVWEIADEWWRTSAIARRYYLVVLEDGKSITIFHDLLSDLWYEQRA